MRAHDITAAEVTREGRAVHLQWSDGFGETLPAVWVWDNADDAFDPATGQRRRSVSELDFGILLDAVALEEDTLVLRARTGVETRLARDRLRGRRRADPAPVRWRGPGALRGLEPVSADAFLREDGALCGALARLATHGLVILTGAEAGPGVVETIVARFGFIRETNYGRLFDVRAEAAPSNLAYTAHSLDLHTDNPYREPVPTLQLLHAIRTDEHGGESYFVDGLAHAEAMAVAEPDAFALLSSQPVEFRYAGPDGAVYEARRPIIARGADGAPHAVHLNHRSLAPLTMDADIMAGWYAAYGAFHRRVHRPAARLSVQLRPGDVALFDNRRILHGRTAFQAQAGGGGRWLQGCYADVDGALATLARLSGR
jgi:gamma-butyrobetaine dioxygenase